MKLLFLLLLTSMPMVFQGQTVYAYNPDSNFDGLYGIDDLLAFLPLFGTEVPQGDYSCDYEGNSLENLFLGHMQGELMIDSIWIDFELFDDVSYYVPGCPESQTDTVIFVGSEMLHTVQSGSSTPTCCTPIGDVTGWAWSNGGISLRIYHSSISGSYVFRATNNTIDDLFTLDDVFGGYTYYDYSTAFSLPFPQELSLTSEGIQGFQTIFDSDDWIYYATHLELVPFWHEVE
jgi:hypothetical protein